MQISALSFFVTFAAEDSQPEKVSNVPAKSPQTAATGPVSEADYVATAEFQRMWPIFLRVSRKDRSPLRRSDGDEGEVVFLGCVLEVFHMRLRSEEEILACLDAVAGVVKVDVSVEKADTHNRDSTDHLTGTGDKSLPLKRVYAEGEKDKMKVYCAAADVGLRHGKQAFSQKSMSGVKYFPKILFEPAPSSSPVCAFEIPKDSTVSTTIEAKTTRGLKEVDYTKKDDIARGRPSSRAVFPRHGPAMQKASIKIDLS